ncbi:hypothetical protein CU102_25870 [Phyllobacterium brassicacearum]|uniref:DUF2946 domain-containing protein n=1 Tax=Phyllobacterium brassicacearum TaxID=314235 RepID=A0A2P7B745_9HYPH|nr:hypothetical protein [Phyllobacterium brassicacearum]PSH62285.1 hypothetical protein CU102_25870 [Phyllobacterium brassicacearum]TDQ16731.1 hypothetical protein DEV91_13113 [Phyllobacterium brassicacearum]
MFERLIQFLLSVIMVASLGLHGIVHAAASGVPVGIAAAAWQQRLDAPADDSGPILSTGSGFDCSSRKQICHGDWFGLAVGGPIRIVQAASPLLVISAPQASSWLPGVLQKPPRI